MVRQLELPHVLSDLACMVQLATTLHQPRGPKAAGRGSRQTHRLPVREACAFVMSKLLIACTVVQGLPRLAIAAAQPLTAQVGLTARRKPTAVKSV